MTMLMIMLMELTALERPVSPSISPVKAGAAEAMIRTNQQTMNKGIVYNNIRNVQSANLHVGKDLYKGVIIQLDTNNVPTDEVIPVDTVAAVVAYASNKLKVGTVKELI